jgi:hypothetical protein
MKMVNMATVQLFVKTVFMYTVTAALADQAYSVMWYSKLLFTISRFSNPFFALVVNVLFFY